MLYAHAGHTTKKKLLHDNVAGTACLIAMVRAQVSLRTGKIGSTMPHTGKRVAKNNRCLGKSKHPRGGNSENKGLFPKIKGAKELRKNNKRGKVVVNPGESNKFTKSGFMNQKLEKEHIAKHLAEFGNITNEEYIQREMKLI